MLIMDWAASEIAGSFISHTFMDSWNKSAKPLNLNDSDMSPTMTELPPEREGATEMVFCMLRYQFGSFVTISTKPDFGADNRWKQFHAGDLSLKNKDEFLDKLEADLESQFLRYCDPIEPLHFLCTLIVRSAVSGMRLRAHHPKQYEDGGASLPQEEKDQLFQWSLKALQYDNMAFSTPSIARFVWHIRCFFQYHALVYLLTEVRVRRVGDEVDTFWLELEKVYQHRPEFMQRKQVIHKAISLLAIQAWDSREQELTRLNLPFARPDFINKLHEASTSRSSRASEASTKTTPFPMPPSGFGIGDAAGLQQVPVSQPWLTVTRDWQPKQPFQTGLITIDTGPPPEEPVPVSIPDWEQWDSLMYGIDTASGIGLPIDLGSMFKQ